MSFLGLSFLQFLAKTLAGCIFSLHLVIAAGPELLSAACLVGHDRIVDGGAGREAVGVHFDDGLEPVLLIAGRAGVGGHFWINYGETASRSQKTEKPPKSGIVAVRWTRVN